MNKTRKTSLGLRPGDYVRVKAPEAILDTLDDSNCLDKMPFMPEMLEACGSTFRVFSRADKTCDTATRTGGRRLMNTVHLEGQRCDGSGHGGCQAACLNFWKEAWLEPVDGKISLPESITYTSEELALANSSLVESTTSRVNFANNGVPIYSCQATKLPEFTRPLSPWDPRQYWRDIATNKVGFGRLLRVGFLSLYAGIVSSGIAYRFWTSTYDSIQRARGKPPWPHRSGALGSTPSGTLDLKVGELVRIKSFDEILQTVDKSNKNRGLRFDPEMVRFCGKILRVHSRVDKIINEGTGEMMNFSNPCIILEGVWCSSDWSAYRRFCPRSIYHWWREIWLERITEPLTGEDIDSCTH